LDPIYVAKRIAFHKLYHSKKNMNGVTAYLKQKQLMGADVETEIYKLGHIFQRNYQKPKTLTAEEKRVLLTTGI